MTGSKWIVTCAAALIAAGASRAAAQEPSEARIQELIRQAAERVANGQTVAADRSEAKPAGDQTAVALTLEDAIKFALDRNLDISVQRLNPQINDITLASVLAAYNPTLTSTVSNASTTSAPTTQLNIAPGGTGPVTDMVTYNGGIAQNLRWGGGSLQVSLNNNRLKSTSNNVLYNPQFQSTWTGLYTQPLFRGFKIDSTRQQIQVTKINRDITDVQLRATITNTLSNVRNAYWDYVFAVQSVEVARRSLDLATKLVQDNQTRVEVGTMAPIDVVQAQSEAATRRQALVQAESNRRTTELALKRLIVSGTEDPNWQASLDPVDRPDFRPEPVDIEAAVRRALSERTDLAIARKNLQANDVTIRFLKDQLHPQADLQVSYGLLGVGGTFLPRSQPGVLGSAVTQPIPGGIMDAFRTLFGNNYPRWNVGVNFSYPLGTSAQEAAMARARVQVTQNEAQLKQIELQVATDVTSAAIQVRNTAEAVQAAQAARELSQKKLEAEQSKFEVGMSTNYFVVQAQRDLSDASNSELRAILNFRKALVEFERLQQTTLQASNVTVINAGGGGAAATTTTTGGGRNTGSGAAGGGFGGAQ